MNRPLRNDIRLSIFPVALFACTLLAIVLHAAETDVRLSPPGLRPIVKPYLVIPADFRYPNRSLMLPDYRDESGRPGPGWSAKYVHTRRFASDESAWIYFRDSDFKRQAVYKTAGVGSALRIWPAGSLLVIEIFKGYASSRKNVRPIEIAVMSKSDAGREPVGNSFYSASWSYARFKPEGTPFITPAKIHECHQCHSIAFHLTGDLIFTQFSISDDSDKF